uniref:Uncharacterized protein n=1 Tax=Panagrolaimus davidi TaxID=227884 RepID=A0A914QX49_9BILA
MKFILDILDTNVEPIDAYIFERTCENQKIEGFNHCFQHLWKEVPALKKCIECDSTCTLASNVCGKCLKPYIDLKIENTVCFSDDDEDIPTVSTGTTDNDLVALLSECTKKLKKSVEEDEDSELEIASPHKFDTKNLDDVKRLEFMWGDMLKFGLECDNVTFAKEIKVKNTVSSPPSVPLKYNRLYDIDKMISPSSTKEQSKPEIEAVTFCQKDERKPMVLRFPSRTLSEKVATNKPPEIALGVEDPSQLPVQFRPVPFHAPQPVTTTLQHQNQLRLTRPPQFSTSTAVILFFSF